MTRKMSDERLQDLLAETIKTIVCDEVEENGGVVLNDLIEDLPGFFDKDGCTRLVMEVVQSLIDDGNFDVVLQSDGVAKLFWDGVRNETTP